MRQSHSSNVPEILWICHLKGSHGSHGSDAGEVVKLLVSHSAEINYLANGGTDARSRKCWDPLKSGQVKR